MKRPNTPVTLVALLMAALACLLVWFADPVSLARRIRRAFAAIPARHARELLQPEGAAFASQGKA